MFSDFKIDRLNNRLQFKIKGLDVSLVNGIRRILISDIPTLAFIGEGPEQSIKFITNNTPLNNEIMANRICLIPLHLSNEETEGFDEENDTIKCELEIENTTNDMINIHSTDIVIFKNDTKMKPSDVARIFPKNQISKEGILITRLRKNEKLHFEAFVKKRTSRQHVAFSPVAGCTYYFDYDQKKGGDILDNQRDYKKNADGSPEACIFSFEIINGLSHRYLVAKAIKVLIKKLDDIRSALENIEQDKISSMKMISSDCCEFVFVSEDDTLGNMLQSYIHDTYVATNKATFTGKRCTYVGYVCPHPLQDIMTLRVTLEDQKDIQPFKTFVSAVCDSLQEVLNNMLNEWYKETLSLDNK